MSFVQLCRFEWPIVECITTAHRFRLKVVITLGSINHVFLYVINTLHNISSFDRNKIRSVQMNDYKQRYIYLMFTTVFHIAKKVYQKVRVQCKKVIWWIKNNGMWCCSNPVVQPTHHQICKTRNIGGSVFYDSICMVWLFKTNSWFVVI